MKIYALVPVDTRRYALLSLQQRRIRVVKSDITPSPE
jgi:hypothetical protein